MPLQIPSFPCPGANKREPEAEEDGQVAPDAEEEATGGDEGAGDEPPELLELIDDLEANRKEASALASTVRSLGRRLRLSPEDRDNLSDFEGIALICDAMKHHSWRGEAMLALCSAMPDLCRLSTINRGAFRDGGALDATVELLRAGISESDVTLATAASISLTALCTGNDGNKKAAAALRGEFNEEELVETDADYRTPLFKAPDRSGALQLLLEALAHFADSVPLQTHGCAALRCLLCDDDSRQASCVPSAVENRELAVNDKNFSTYRKAVERALFLEASGPAQLRLREQAMLLLREISCRQDRIHELVFEAKLLPSIEDALGNGDERVVRASLAVIRAFAFSDDLKEQLAVLSNVAAQCVVAVRRHFEHPSICEQAFGLFANLTMRKSHIASKLNGPEFRVIAVGFMVLEKHKQKPTTVRSVLQTIRNVATQDEAAALEVKESELFSEMQELVVEKQGNDKWRSPVEIAKQFLREFREDEGIRKPAAWNEFY
mmetsp:Transcript_71476/g.155255  ORF Transcript_71476/g.155255 Transcript_71476/m.155255 type:complete len:494 (+) Transcript_71476:72-1553(+)